MARYTEAAPSVRDLKGLAAGQHQAPKATEQAPAVKGLAASHGGHTAAPAGSANAGKDAGAPKGNPT
jgi:hypothetical protein